MTQPPPSARLESNPAVPEATPGAAVRRGRPSRRTEEVVNTICHLIRTEGLADTPAGALAGVSSTTLSRWKEEDEDFAIDLAQARALFEVDRLREVREARKRDGSADWRAAAWLLQNACAEGYRRPRPRRGGGESPAQAGEPSSSSSASPSASPAFDLQSPSRTVERGALNTSGASPEIPEIHAALQPADAAETLDASLTPDAASAIGVIRPEIPEIQTAPARLRLSRRARRAEERRMAREAGRARTREAVDTLGGEQN